MPEESEKQAGFTLRVANLDDAEALEQLIAESVHGLQAHDYTLEQRNAAIGSVFGVDRQLILDGTYFVVEGDSRIVACGGWSRRKTLFGGDHQGGREDALLDPSTEAARIRAFFVRPGYERRGIGSAIMRASEEAAAGEGFTSLELRATLTGIPLYRAHGFIETEMADIPLPSGGTLPTVQMVKVLQHGRS
ncbi:MAG TPA: GNAT family N-acetyltransferase [Terriglobales bacterium]|jgi:GNAT superfamily N-acetyltransferase